jgi:hypothetical protein
VGSFPALPSGSNSALGGAAGAAGAGASIYNNLQDRLQTAARQHAALLRQQQLDQQTLAQREFENSLRLNTQGAVPADIEGGGTGKPGGGFKTRTPNPAAQGEGQTIIDPVSGKRFYIPTAAEKEERSLNDTNSFVPHGQLGAMLESAGHAPGKRMKPADSHSLMMALNEAAPKDEPFDIDTSGKFQDAGGKPVPVIIGKKTGKVRLLDLSGVGADQTPQGTEPLPGGSFDLGQAMSQFPFASPQQQPPAQPAQRGAARPAGGVGFQLPEKAAKPDKYTYNHFTDDRGAVSVTRIGPDDSIPEKWDGKKWVPLEASEAIGPKRRDPDAAPRQKPPSAAQLRMVTKTKADRLEKAQGAYKKAIAGAIDDSEKTQAAADLKQEYQAAQNEYESGISTLTGNDVQHNDWADRMSAGEAHASAGGKNDPAGVRPAGKKDPLGIR